VPIQSTLLCLAFFQYRSTPMALRFGGLELRAGSRSLAFTRTAAEVSSIVYAGGAAGTGRGFFPNALNGNVK
jgi:hypothetical protein